MATQRLIGIDFGTSTSVLRVKRYENGEPVADRLMTIPVTFNMGNSMVPTLVQKLESSSCYGYEAQISRRKAKLYQNFKVKLESSDETERTEARALTEEFFKYLAGEYNAQSESGFFGEGTDQEKTIVSFPVKWSDETKAFMIEAAKKAGFKNVEGMDEARAAIQAITVQNADMLKQKGYFMDGQPVNILLVDMGAGTTDMVICRHTPGENGNTQILATWPKDGNVLFGGHEVDELLVSYMRKKLPEDEAATILKRCGVEKFKAWKENIISGALAKQESVTYFSDLDLIVNLLEIDMEPYALNRAEFEALAAEYLKGLPELLKGCLDEAKLDGAQIDLVILTGGHSQWYFVRELLTSGLSKIEADPNRLVSIVRPQETVALGMVYDPLAKQTIFQDREDDDPQPVDEADEDNEPVQEPSGTAGNPDQVQSQSLKKEVHPKPGYEYIIFKVLYAASAYGHFYGEVLGKHQIYKNQDFAIFNKYGKKLGEGPAIDLLRYEVGFLGKTKAISMSTATGNFTIYADVPKRVVQEIQDGPGIAYLVSVKTPEGKLLPAEENDWEAAFTAVDRELYECELILNMPSARRYVTEDGVLRGELLNRVKTYIASHEFVREYKDKFDDRRVTELGEHLYFPPSEAILCHDSSLSERGKDGFAISSKGFHVKELWEAPKHVDWRRFIRAATIQRRLDSLGVIEIDSLFVISYIIGLPRRVGNADIDFFKDLQAFCRAQLKELLGL